MAAPVTYDLPFAETYYHTGVDLSPEAHAVSQIQALHQRYVSAALLDPKVSSAIYGSAQGDGVGNEWTIHFSEKSHSIEVLEDRRTKSGIGRTVRKRVIRYVLKVETVQRNVPNAGTASAAPAPVKA